MKKIINELEENRIEKENIFKKISKVLDKDINFLENYLPELEWKFRPSDKELIKSFYSNRISYGCFSLKNFNFHLYFSKDTNKFMFLVNDSVFFQGDNYEEYWESFRLFLEKYDTGIYKKYIRLLKFNSLL